MDGASNGPEVGVERGQEGALDGAPDGGGGDAGAVDDAGVEVGVPESALPTVPMRLEVSERCDLLLPADQVASDVELLAIGEERYPIAEAQRARDPMGVRPAAA